MGRDWGVQGLYLETVFGLLFLLLFYLEGGHLFVVTSESMRGFY